jgi:alkyl sulfatase BDS1-like metallo-beta-lactamase superfamily hydrolase
LNHSGPADALGPLAKVVVAGASYDADEPIPITDSIYLSPDISNSFLITTDDGNVVINAGTEAAGPRHKSLYRAVSSGPIGYLVLTQSHLDHIGGVDHVRDQDTRIVAHTRFTEISASRRMLGPYWSRRNGPLLEPLIGKWYNANPIPPLVEPDITVDHRLELVYGGRRLELLSVPGGETLDSIAIWLPDERALFTGNMFGPILGDLPNLYTIRGDRIRSATEFVRCVDRVLALDPELVLEGHGTVPLDGATFRARATRVRDAVAHLHDWTIEGMNAGKELRTLMGTAQLPEALRVAETHGKLSWCVRAIWEEYVGWFEFRSTTELYDVPPTAVHADIVDVVGGSQALVARARERLARGELMEALYLAEAALHGGDDVGALDVVCSVHEQMLEQTGGQNYFETLWLQLQIRETQARIERATTNDRGSR